MSDLKRKKQVVLTLDDKINIINRLQKEELEPNFAAAYDVARFTIIEKKDAEKIQNHVATMMSLDGHSKKRKMRIGAKSDIIGTCTRMQRIQECQW